MDFLADKGALRRAQDAARRALAPAEHRRRDVARTRHLLARLDGPGVVALYASRPGEPGTKELIKELKEKGWRVLLPKLRREPDWAWDDGEYRLGAFGIPEPAGPGLGETALGLADVVVLPCLAVAVDGTRLGTGGGWYDRALPHARPGIPRWALANASEVVGHLPREPHDLPVDAVVTEAGFTVLRSGRVS